MQLANAVDNKESLRWNIPNKNLPFLLEEALVSSQLL
jgi:hypothetical protein